MTLITWTPGPPWVPTLEEWRMDNPHHGHEGGFIAVSRTHPRVKRWCCDNCSRHHWGEYVTYGFETKETDFDYQHPDGSPYLCANGHTLYGGPEYCMGTCWPCERAFRGE